MFKNMHYISAFNLDKDPDGAATRTVLPLQMLEISDLLHLSRIYIVDSPQGGVDLALKSIF